MWTWFHILKKKELVKHKLSKKKSKKKKKKFYGA